MSCRWRTDLRPFCFCKNTLSGSLHHPHSHYYDKSVLCGNTMTVIIQAAMEAGSGPHVRVKHGYPTLHICAASDSAASDTSAGGITCSGGAPCSLCRCSSAAVRAGAPDAGVGALAVLASARLLRRLCWQMLAPPQSFGFYLRGLMWPLIMKGNLT